MRFMERKRIINIWISESLLRRFEKQIVRDGFRSRSDAIVYLIRLYLECREDWFKKFIRQLNVL